MFLGYATFRKLLVVVTNDFYSPPLRIVGRSPDTCHNVAYYFLSLAVSLSPLVRYLNK